MNETWQRDLAMPNEYNASFAFCSPTDDRRMTWPGISVPVETRDWKTERNREMPKKTFAPEQIVAQLRQIEVLLSQGKTVPAACKDAGITAQTFYRWRKEYGGLQVEQAKKMKEL